MKRKSFFAVLLAIALCLAATACGNGKNNDANDFALGEDAAIIWLDRYGETDVPLASGDPTALDWTSADETVVTVTDGHLVAQGEGETTVTVTNGVKSASISVRVNDSGALPNISVADFDAYMDADIAIPATVRYNGDEMNTDGVVFTAEIEDTTIATYADGKIRGVALGQTNAVIRTNYKGLELERQCVITVRENSIVNFGDPIELYAVVGNDKLSSIVLQPEVFVAGQKVADADISYRIVEGDGYVELDGATGTVTALEEGQAVIEGTFDNNGTPVTGRVNITVHPNWVAGSFFNGSLYDVTWRPAEGIIGGREAAGTDMMEYRAPEDFSESLIWEYHVSGSDTGTLLLDLYRKGYRYFAYDVYYGSDASFYFGTGRDPQFVSVGEFFRRDYAQIFCDTDGDGVQEITNRVVKNQWMTFSFSLLSLIELNPSWTSEFFFLVRENTTSSYVMNVRYYLDGTFIPGDENLVYTDMGSYVQATNDEFDVAWTNANELPEYGPYDGTVGGRTTAYHYTTNSNSGWSNNLVVASSMNKSYDLGLTKLYSRGQYLTFDVYVERGSIISMSLNHTLTAATITLGKTELSQFSSWLNVIKDGKLQYTIEAGEWYTICLGFRDAYLPPETPNRWRATIYFAANELDSSVYIDNVRYEKTRDFMPAEYEGMAPPTDVEAPHPDTAVMTEQEGVYAGMTKYISTNSGTGWDNHAASVRFTGVTINNTAAGSGRGNPAYFGAGYQYIKLDFLLSDNADGFGFYSWATYQGQGGVAHEGALDIGAENLNRLLLFDAQTQEFVEVLEGNKWYTLFIPTDYTGSETPDWAMIEFRSRGGSTDAPAVVYLDNIEFTYEAYELPEIVWEPFVSAAPSEIWSLTDVTEGEFADGKKFDKTTASWGVSLSLIDSDHRELYSLGAKYVTMKVRFENLQYIEYKDNMFTQNVVHNEGYTFGTKLENAEWLRFINEAGKIVTTLQNGVTYTMCVKLGQTSYVGWGDLHLTTIPTDEAVEAGQSGSMYYTDVQVHTGDDPFYGLPGESDDPDAPVDPDGWEPVAYGNSEDWSLTDVTEGEFAGGKKYDKTAANWNAYLVLISSTDKTLYEQSVKYVTMKVRFENVQYLEYRDNMFTQSVVHSELYNFGSAFSDAEWLRFMDEAGKIVSALENGVTYTMCIKLGQDSYVGWGDLHLTPIPTDAAVEAGQSATMYYTDILWYTGADPFYVAPDAPVDPDGWEPVAYGNSEDWSLTDVTEGEFAGGKKYDKTAANWNAYLVLISSTDKTLYEQSVKYVTMKVRFENVQYLEYKDNMFAGGVEHSELYNFGSAFSGAEWMRFMNESGETVSALENGVTYTMCIKLGQDSYVGWGDLHLTPIPTDAAVEAGQSATMYYTDILWHTGTDPFSAR